MNKEPLISIIVPVYNVEKYLPKCLDSLLNQTYRNIEIICVNDGSPDNSILILEDYKKKDDRIIIVNQNNKGLSGARNAGIRIASGEYIMFVDSDDWIDSDTCSLALEAAIYNNADLVLWSYSREYGNQSKPKFMFWEDGKVFDAKMVKDEIHRRLCGLYGEELSHPEYAHAIETAWGKLYLASIIKKHSIRFVDTKIIGTEDALFNIYVLGYVNKVVYIRKALNHYRKDNESSLTSTYKKDLFKQWQTLFGMIYRYIKDNNLSSDYYIALYNRIALSIVGLGLNTMSAEKSILWKLRTLNKIISDKKYRRAYAKLDFSYFPLHWKVFFFCAKYKLTFGLYILLAIINKMV